MMTRRSIVLLIFYTAMLTFFIGVGNPAPAAPTERVSTEGFSSLPPSAQSAISGVLGRDDCSYHAVSQGRGFHAENPKHVLSTDFTSKGVQVQNGASHWGLALSGYGYGDKLRAMKDVAPEAEANRVEYRRGVVTEWYVNGPMGLEQGFTLLRAPGKSGEGPLTLGLRLSGELTASINSEKDGLTLTRRDGQVVLHYGGLIAYDAAGKQLHAWLQAKGGQLLLRVDDAGALYPVVVDPMIETGKLTASDGATDDYLGASVAISGDTVVVGAPLAKVGFNYRQGAVYVFVKTGSGWTETAKLTASDGEKYNQFGHTVAVSGDTVMVGVPYADVVNDSQGAVYVFVKPMNGWRSMTESAKLAASDGNTSAYFGYSVAMSGDFMAIGTPGAKIGNNWYQGAVYVFVKSGSGWNETAKLTASDGSYSDELGYSVGISGGTVIAGAPYSNDYAGAAYVFVKSGTGWVNMTQAAKLTVSDGSSGNEFSKSVGISGDTVIAGAPYSNSYTGAAYVFVKSGSGWANMTETAKLHTSDPTTNAAFGFAVAISGDIALAGDPGIIADHSIKGAVYLFEKPAGGWASMSETSKIVCSEPSCHVFGYSVAISGDIAIGAPWTEIDGNTLQGAAYVFAPPHSADLALSISDEPDPVSLGDPITYTITVTGDPFFTATEVNLIDRLPAGVTFVSASAGCAESGGTVTCDLGTIPNLSSRQIAITVQANSLGIIINAPRVSARENDPDLDNNVAVATTAVN